MINGTKKKGALIGAPFFCGVLVGLVLSNSKTIPA